MFPQRCITKREERPRRFGHPVPSVSPIILLLAFSGLSFCTGSSAFAQGRASLTRAGSPGAPIPVVVDAWSGRTLWVGGHLDAHQPSTETASALSTSMCFDNADLSGLSSPLPIGVEIVDWGVKSCQGTGLVTRLAIGYSTSAIDPSAGGPGASFSFALYAGTTGFGVLGTELARFDLSGMPGIQPGGTTLEYALFLDFGNKPLSLQDGNIGCGFMALDSATGPLLSTAPDPTLGTQDLLDLYAPGPATAASYVTTGPPFPGLNSGSIALQVEELDPTPLASTSVDLGSGVNPMVFTEVQAAVIGETWVGVIDLSGFPGANITVVGVSEGPFAAIQTAFGELLVNAGSPGFFLDVGFGLHGQPILPLVNQIGRTYRAQGAVVLSGGAGVQFTNALVVKTGF